MSHNYSKMFGNKNQQSSPSHEHEVNVVQQMTNQVENVDEPIVEEVKHPYKVSNKATLNIYSKTLNDNVMNTMKDMNEKSYTHIPIYDETNKHLVGIFSENSLFQYILEDKIIEVDENTKFNDIKKCIDIKFSKEIVKFVAKDNLYDDVVNEFISEFKNKNKLSCVMITQNGKETEKVIGIITAWDIIGR